MGKDKLDQLFNESLGDYASDIDTNELWKAIESDVDSKKEKRFPWLYVLASLVILITIAGLIKYMNVQSNSIAVYEPTSPVATSTTEGKLSNIEQEAKTETSVHQKPSTTQTPSKVNTDLKTKTPTHSSKDNSPSKPNLQVTNTKTTSASLANVNNPTLIVNQTVTNGISKLDQSITKVLVSPCLESTKSIDQSDTKTSKISTATQDESHNSLDNKNLLSSKEQAVLSNRQTQLLSTDFIDSWDLSNIDISRAQVSLKDNELPSEQRIWGLPNRNYFKVTGFSIGADLALYYSNPLFKYKLVDTLNQSNYIQTRQQTESYQEAFSARVLGRYQWNQGLYVQAGLSYGQIDERFRFKNNFKDTIQGNVPITITILANNQRDTIFGSGDIAVHSFIEADVYNYHRFIDVHLGIGYEIAMNDYFGAYIDANIGLNVTSWHKGYILAPDMSLHNFKEKPIYKKQLGINLLTNFGLRYRHGSMSYHFGPSVQYYFSDWLNDKNLLEQKYFNIGIHGGAMYMF